MSEIDILETEKNSNIISKPDENITKSSNIIPRDVVKEIEDVKIDYRKIKEKYIGLTCGTFTLLFGKSIKMLYDVKAKGSNL